MLLHLEALDVAVGLKRGHEHVEDPQSEQKTGSGVLELDRASQFPADGRQAAQQHHQDADEGAAAEHGDGESEGPGVDDEWRALYGVIDGGNRPGDSDAQKDVDGVTSGHVTNGGVGVAVVDGSHLTGKRI